jgi:AcrR family transcriptional regulator
MARTSGSSGPATFEAIRKAGLKLIYRHGYEAMTLRQLAAEIGLVQGSLYNHIATKQELLFKLISDHMQHLLMSVDHALSGITDPSARLIAFTEFHVTYHIDRKQEVFISYSELRSLEPDNFEAIVVMRRAYEQKLVDILNAGIEKRVFSITDAQTTAFGILSMLSGICTWFNPKGRLSKDEVCAIFVEMTQGAVFDKGAAAGFKAKGSGAKLRGKHVA